MHTMHGSCYCGNITFTAGLTAPAESFEPRACDCDFCTKHGAAWVTDAQGTLEISVRDGSTLGKFRQGSESADFLSCTKCSVLCAVVYNENGVNYGAINSRAVNQVSFPPAKTVSPKKLPNLEKIARWKEIWFKNVRITF
ncbi:MAG: hypothetical protein JSU04_19610 [Bdellovibrionales bacterium]|nr:hypothetical protein [Bdellovibrionales bacterium]